MSYRQYAIYNTKTQLLHGTSQLGRNYGWKGMQARGVEMAADREARIRSQQLERRRLIERLFASGDMYADLGSEKRTRFWLAAEVQKLSQDSENLSTEQIRRFTGMLDHDELRRELYRLRRINRQKKERGPRILSL